MLKAKVKIHMPTKNVNGFRINQDIEGFYNFMAINPLLPLSFIILSIKSQLLNRYRHAGIDSTKQIEVITIYNRPN